MMNIVEAKEKLVAAVKEFVSSAAEGGGEMDFEEYCYWVGDQDVSFELFEKAGGLNYLTTQERHNYDDCELPQWALDAFKEVEMELFGEVFE